MRHEALHKLCEADRNEEFKIETNSVQQGGYGT